MNLLKNILSKSRELFRIEGDPKYVAKGFALGSFVGMLPFPGLQIFISLIIASIIKVHRSAAVIGVFNTNIVTGAFVFAFNYYLGKTILGLNPAFEFPDKISLDFINTILTSGSDVFLSLIVGRIVNWLHILDSELQPCLVLSE